MNEQKPASDDEAWGRAAGAALRATETLDAVTSARLSAARARAIGAAGTARRSPWTWALPGALAASLLALTLLPDRAPTPGPLAAAPGDVAAREALEVLTDEQDPQFYQDLDLYLWLDSQAAHA